MNKTSLILTLFLVGCSDTIPGYNVRFVVEQCGSLEKVHEINVGYSTAVCTDGKIVDYLSKRDCN
jgi:hypothetical protein